MTDSEIKQKEAGYSLSLTIIQGAMDRAMLEMTRKGINPSFMMICLSKALIDSGVALGTVDMLGCDIEEATAKDIIETLVSHAFLSTVILEREAEAEAGTKH